MISLYKSVFLVTVVCLGVYFGTLLGPQVINCTPLYKAPVIVSHKDQDPYERTFSQSSQYSLACTVSSIVWSTLFMAGMTAMFTGLLGSVEIKTTTYALKDEKTTPYDFS